MAELRELKASVKNLASKIEENTKITQGGFDTMNGRVKTLEIAEAKREGRESVSNGSQLDWKKVTLSLLSIIGTSLAIAYLVLKAVLK